MNCEGIQSYNVFSFSTTCTNSDERFISDHAQNIADALANRGGYYQALVSNPNITQAQKIDVLTKAILTNEDAKLSSDPQLNESLAKELAQFILTKKVPEHSALLGPLLSDIRFKNLCSAFNKEPKDIAAKPADNNDKATLGNPGEFPKRNNPPTVLVGPELSIRDLQVTPGKTTEPSLFQQIEDTLKGLFASSDSKAGIGTTYGDTAGPTLTNPNGRH